MTFIRTIPTLSHFNQKCVLHLSYLCFMYSVGVGYTYLDIAWAIADYLFRYSEVEAFRYVNRLLLKVFLLLVFKKMCFLPAITPFP